MERKKKILLVFLQHASLKRLMPPRADQIAAFDLIRQLLTSLRVLRGAVSCRAALTGHPSVLVVLTCPCRQSELSDIKLMA